MTNVSKLSFLDMKEYTYQRNDLDKTHQESHNDKTGKPPLAVVTVVSEL